MSKCRRSYGFLLALLLMLLFAVPCSAAEETPQNPEETLKNGLVYEEEEDVWRYYEDGAAVTDSLKTVDGKIYYFQADETAAVNCWITEEGKEVKASSSKKMYYFGENGQAYTGLQVIRAKLKKGPAEETFFQFKSSGKLNKKKTNKLQKAARYEANYAPLQKLIGKPKSKKYRAGCYGAGTGKDGILKYKNFTVYTFRFSTGREIYLGVEGK